MNIVNGINIDDMDTTVYRITIADILAVAEQKFGRSLSKKELEEIINKDLIQDAFGSMWWETMYCGLDEAGIDPPKEE